MMDRRATLRLGLGSYGGIFLAPITILMVIPCPAGLPEILSAAHIGAFKNQGP